MEILLGLPAFALSLAAAFAIYRID